MGWKQLLDSKITTKSSETLASKLGTIIMDSTQDIPKWKITWCLTNLITSIVLTSFIGTILAYLKK